MTAIDVTFPGHSHDMMSVEAISDEELERWLRGELSLQCEAINHPDGTYGVDRNRRQLWPRCPASAQWAMCIKGNCDHVPGVRRYVICGFHKAQFERSISCTRCWTPDTITWVEPLK